MIDPELEALLDFMPVIELDDPVAARRAFEKLLVSMRTPLPEAELLDDRGPDDSGLGGRPRGVRARLPAESGRRGPGDAVPGILLIHGGGFIVGSVEAEHVGAVLMAVDAGAVLVSVDYRLAPEHPYPAGLARLLRRAVVPPRGGGCARRGPGADRAGRHQRGRRSGRRHRALSPGPGRPCRSASRCCTFPSSTTASRRRPCSEFVDSPLWNPPLAVKSWQAYLGDLAGTDDVPIYAAPARATDLAGLPPAYVSTAENDPLRDEGIAYALALLRAGVSVELHQFPGTFHGSALVTRAAVRAGRRRRRRSSCGARSGWPRRKRTGTPDPALPARGRDDRTVESGAEHGAVIGRVAVVRDGTVGRGHPVAASVGRREDRVGGVEAAHLTGRTPEVAGVAVVVDGAVGEEDPVPVSVRRAHGGGHRRALRSGGAVVRGVTERVDVAALGHEPVAVAAGVGHDGHRRPGAAADPRAAAGEAGVAEGEDAAVGGDHEVPTAVGGRHHAHDGALSELGNPEPAGWSPSPGIDP